MTGADQIEKKVYMDISDNVIDYDDPYITYKYTSDCMNVLLGNCEDGTWSIEVTAQDTGSGKNKFFLWLHKKYVLTPVYHSNTVSSILHDYIKTIRDNKGILPTEQQLRIIQSLAVFS